MGEYQRCYHQVPDRVWVAYCHLQEQEQRFSPDKRLPGDRQVLYAGDEATFMQLKLNARHTPETGEPFQQGSQSNSGLQPGKRSTDAEVDAIRVSDQRLKRSRFSLGMPRSSAITMMGSGAARSRIISISPSSRECKTLLDLSLFLHLPLMVFT